MYSLRRSLTGYLLALLVGTLAVVGLVIDQVTGRSLAARQSAAIALIDAQFEQRCQAERQRVDDELLQAARKFGVEIQREFPQRVQEEFARFNAARLFFTFGSGLPWTPLTLYSSPFVATRYAREYFAPIQEELLRRVENPDQEPDYFELFSPWWRSTWRSESLGLDTLPPQRVDDWAFDDTVLSPSLVPVRRLVLRVPRQFSPFPQRRTARFGTGPNSPSPAPGSRPPDALPRPGPDAPPRTNPLMNLFALSGQPPAQRFTFPLYSSAFGWAPPTDTFYIQAARPRAAIDQKIAAFEEQRDKASAQVMAQIAAERQQLRSRLLLIGLVTFLGIAVGGPWLIGVGLRPLRDLASAVSRVSEKDFKLPHNGQGLPRELAGIHDRLTQTLDMLRRAFAREKQAVADISHELRTPIASLQATLDVALRKSRSPEQYREVLEDCRRINKQLAQLVERIMTLASLDAGNDRLEISRVNASEIADACAAVIRPLATSHQLTFHLDVAEDLELDTDPDKLREILMNLLHNAVEYNRPGGQVDLLGYQDQGQVVFEVRDTGIGMTPEVSERIFERFFRADPSRHATGVHAGLGLSIVREYVTRLGGTITVSSRPGEGSTFRLGLPAPQDRPPSPSLPSLSASVGASASPAAFRS